MIIRSSTRWKQGWSCKERRSSRYETAADRLLKLVELGVPIEEINVGNMSQTNETRSITKSINVVDQDVEVFNKLQAKGVRLVAQMVPSDKAENFMALLAK